LSLESYWLVTLKADSYMSQAEDTTVTVVQRADIVGQQLRDAIESFRVPMTPLPHCNR
jgi:hypothetical protein